MSTRTKEEIERDLKDAKATAWAFNTRVEQLEAELAALPKEPVELVAEEWSADRGKLIVTRKGSVFGVCTIPKDNCTHVGIDPAHLARFITTYTFLPRLMELTFSEDGNWRPLSEPDVTHKERRDLARRYHAAMKGGAA